jgi:penicillin-binding protein 1A
MREIHQGLPFRDFVRPNAGIIDVTVCVKSGLLKTPSCNEGDIALPFLEGTQPVLLCEYHGNSRGIETVIRHIELGSRFVNTVDVLGELSMPVIRDEWLMRELQEELRRPQNRQSSPSSRTAPSSTSRTNPSLGSAGASGIIPFNPLLDDLPPAPRSTAPAVPVVPANSTPAVFDDTPDVAAAPVEVSAELPVEVRVNLPVEISVENHQGPPHIPADSDPDLEPPSYNPLLD